VRYINVHLIIIIIISVEFSEYNIELVDLVDFRVDFRYLNSTQLSDDRLDRFRGLLRGDRFIYDSSPVRF